MIYVYITRGEGWESRRLLGRALRDWGAPVGRLEHDSRGKPYVPGGPEISISHSDGVVVVALAKEPVGVDIQRHRPIRENLPRRVLSQPEYDWYAARGCQERDFFALWALKESYYKYLGHGTARHPQRHGVPAGGGVLEPEGGPEPLCRRVAIGDPVPGPVRPGGRGHVPGVS